MNWARVCGCCISFISAGYGQTTATLNLRVLGPDGSSVAGAVVRLENPTTSFKHELLSAGDGAFYLKDIPLQTYRLTVTAPEFATETREVPLRTNVPVMLELSLKLALVKEQVTVGVFETRELVDVEATGTRTALTAAAMEKLPAPLGSRGLENYLVTFPGFAPNANGAIHPRGAHNQMTYVIDGMPISDQMTGAFATSIDPSMVASLELYTGDIPAEFGAKVSGVAVVSTRGGAGSGRKFFGESQFGGGAFDTVQNVTQFGGESGKLGWFVSLFGVKTNRFLDQVSLDNLHNGGNSQRGFLRLDYQATERDTVRFNAMTGRSSFELANLRSQHAAGMDQRQLMRDASFWLRWNRVLSPRSTWESTVAWRPTIAQLFPSEGDNPVTADQARHLSTVTFANRYNRVAGSHNLRGGADFQRFHISENFRMGITDPEFNVPGSDRFNDALAAHDLTRAGRYFSFSGAQWGSLSTAFLQDSIKLGRFVISLGGRYDLYRLLVHSAQWQPRVGMAFHLRETGTVFRASYNRNFQTPPNENLLLSSSAAAAQLAPASVRNALGNTATPLKAQRENVYEVGVQQALFRRATLNASFYHKNSRDQQDNNNFFDTGIIFPVTLARIRVNGVEGRITLPTIHGLSATVSATHSRAVTTPPFTGGLFLGQDAVDLLSSGPFLIDHDQKLSVQVTAHQTVGRNWWMSSSVRYDSGLVSNPSDPLKVAADTDYSDLLPYVDLAGNPARVRPRTITDVAVGYQHKRGEVRRLWDAQLQFSNVLNQTALYNFQSVFVGTRAVPPRSAAVRLRFYW